MNRRSFLATGAAAAVTAGISSNVMAEELVAIKEDRDSYKESFNELIKELNKKSKECPLTKKVKLGRPSLDHVTDYERDGRIISPQLYRQEDGPTQSTS